MGGRILHTGSLASDPSIIPDLDQLLLADSTSYEVFTYRLSTRKKTIRKKSPRLGPPFYGYPRTVSYGFYNNTVFFIVSLCYGGNLGNKIIIYDSEWNHVRSLVEMEVEMAGLMDLVLLLSHLITPLLYLTITTIGYQSSRWKDSLSGRFWTVMMESQNQWLCRSGFLISGSYSGDKLYRYKYE